MNSYVLDTGFYKNFYSDLSKLSSEKLKNHFKRHGQKEGRFRCQSELDDFILKNQIDLNFYKNFYSDMRKHSDQVLIKHIQSHGLKENRFLSEAHLKNFVDKCNNANINLFDILLMQKDVRDISGSEAFLKRSKNVLQVSSTVQKIKNEKTNQTYCFSQKAEKYFLFQKHYEKTCKRKYITRSSNNYTIQHNLENYSDLEGKEVSYLHENHCKNTFVASVVDYDHIETLDFLTNNFILVIDFANLGGGTTFFINTIVSKYKYKQTFVVLRTYCEKNNDIISEDHTRYSLFINDDYKWKNICENEVKVFLHKKQNQIQKIFVNHTLNFNESILLNIFSIPVEKIMITHDYNLITSNPHPYLDVITFNTNKKININSFDTIITQNICNYHNFKAFLKPCAKVVVTPLPDYRDRKCILTSSNEKIRVACIGQISEGKGQRIVYEIIDFIQKHNLNIEVFCFGDLGTKITKNCFYYKNIEHLNSLLEEHKPNCLLETSLWSESYSYTLTLKLITKLPIFSLRKPFNSVIENRLQKLSSNFHFFDSCEEAIQLIQTYSSSVFYTIEPKIYFNEFWENFFISKKEIIPGPFLGSFKNNIKPYVIYFPQFHSFAENNLSFYEDFNDAKNLHYLLTKTTENVSNFETPSKSYFDISSTEDYCLLNTSILQKQMDLLEYYNISGLTIYYYWFAVNTITKKKKIMEAVINKFFDGSVDLKGRKIFLTWANESWTKNPAFNVDSDRIENHFTEKIIKQFAKDVLVYFQHESYLKIDNKPVFNIYHPWFFSKEDLNKVYFILNATCKEAGFKGIYFFRNQQFQNDMHNLFLNNYHHFNYKNNSIGEYDEINQRAYFNYKKYIDTHVLPCGSDGIQTLAFDFDNRARMVKPNRLKYTTVCTGNTEVEKVRMINEIAKKYDDVTKPEVERILLVNAFNEWGEKMTMEPSNEYGFYNMNLLIENLKDKN